MILAVFTDFDGTIVNIAKTPDSVRVGKKVINVLEDLEKTDNVRFAVITGRSLKNIRKVLPLKKTVFAGNHGLEIYIPGKGMVLKAEGFEEKIEFIARELKKRLKGVSGVLIEDKKYSVAVHYRNAGEKNGRIIKNTVYKTVSGYAVKKDFKFMTGKKIIELIPKVKWDKGKAVSWIIKYIERLELQKVFPVFIGDDITDEPAFKAVNRAGLSVFVGNESRQTSARYRINSPSEVIRFLQKLLRVLKEGT